MRKLDSSPRLKEHLLRASLAVGAIDWNKTFGIPYGACIPISVFTVAYLKEEGITAQVVEAGARYVDPISTRYAEIATNTDEPAMNATDAPGLDFLGHAVVRVPTHRAVADLSLPTQQSQVIKNLGSVDVLVGEVDHTKGQVGFKTPYGRGQAWYRIYPKRDGWSKRDWPWDDIRAAAGRAYRAEGEFEWMRDGEYEVSYR